MKINFSDKSYIELSFSTSTGKIVISIGAKNLKNPLETIINSVELNLNEFNNLLSDLKKTSIKNVEETTTTSNNEGNKEKDNNE